MALTEKDLPKIQFIKQPDNFGCRMAGEVYQQMGPFEWHIDGSNYDDDIYEEKVAKFRKISDVNLHSPSYFALTERDFQNLKNDGCVAYVKEQLHQIDATRSEKKVCLEQPTEVRFSLLIRRYDSYQTFGSLEDLREEVGRYFTEREKASGIVDRLTSPMLKNESPGYWTGEQKYQDMTVTCDVFFPAFDDPTIQTEVIKKRKSLAELMGDQKPALDDMLVRASAKVKQQAQQGMKELGKQISFSDTGR